jgi:hypothetical protein
MSSPRYTIAKAIQEPQERSWAVVDRVTETAVEHLPSRDAARAAAKARNAEPEPEPEPAVVLPPVPLDNARHLAEHAASPAARTYWAAFVAAREA